MKLRTMGEEISNGNNLVIGNCSWETPTSLLLSSWGNLSTHLGTCEQGGGVGGRRGESCLEL